MKSSRRHEEAKHREEEEEEVLNEVVNLKRDHAGW
jgi:hypothetical protein